MRAKFFIFWICCSWLVVGSAPCFGQDPTQTALSQTVSMPAWIVPVLRLVSATHVEPTTGVVISDSGLVLVSDDFASSADEIIVLDGGTDIIRNGRPAKIAHRFPSAGLMILSVSSLQRDAARFSKPKLADGDSIRLQAFPPAEMIEQGAPPLNVPTTISILPENKQPALAGDTPLPNVTGPILDACGRLAGYSSADGVQSMATSKSPRYHWKDQLLAILEEMQIDIIELPCKQLHSTIDPEDETLVETVAEPIQEPTPEAVETVAESADETAPADEEINGEETDEDKPADNEPDLDEETLMEQDGPPPVEESADSADDAVHEETGAGAWLLAAILLLVSVIVLHRIRNQKRLHAQVQATSGHPAAGPGQDRNDEPACPVPGPDSLLVIEGVLSDGTQLKQHCQVSSKAINIVIGRGGADINIDSAAVSRQHASLNGTRDMLTITDLGSSNGTSINGIPCLEGEIMFIEPGDIIVLGNARFTCNIIPDEHT